MAWDPGPDPFPSEEIRLIDAFEYLDELELVCHARVHVDMVPKSLWQLSADFRARVTVHPKGGGAGRRLTLKAPRGMFTDLASVPKIFWSVIGPIGKHLEASILHDYLYMAWTDFRKKAERRDWDFADGVLWEGMKASGVPAADRNLIKAAVHSDIGWDVFRKKTWTLKERMDAWLPLLAPGHGRA